MPPYYGNRNHKLYDFVAHGSAVTCLALGQKSGRVMVTGGDDAKINLWAIGKPNCIMSLNGHKTSIECAKFNHNEDIVGAGSASGAIKLWDLEAAKLIQTLTGHKTNVRCIDFHPYGQFLASGSFDTNIKLWDYRKKGCIFTYKVHSKDVHCLKLSPDGRWLASGGNEGSVMLYDIVAGKMLAELKGHSQSVTDVVFHPNEFLLSSSSLDGTVKFWDLESFQQVSTTGYLGPVRKVAFHPEGKALLSSGKDVLKVFGWEPTKQYDSLEVNWGKLSDMCVLEDQLIAGTCSTTNVSVYMVDIGNLHPFAEDNRRYSVNFPRGNLRQSTRRSFNFDQTNKTCKQLESLESNRTDDIETIGSDGDDSMAEIFNACDYKEIFHSKREYHQSPSLPDSNPSHSYSIASFSSKSNGLSSRGGSHRNHSSSLSPSVRHLSESLNNLHLNHKNNNTSLLHSSALHSSNLLASSTSGYASSNLLNNNSHSSSLSHASSLSGLNHLKPEHPSTFPALSTPKSSHSSPHYPSYNGATTLSPLSPLPPTSAPMAVVPSNLTTTSKVTSVVRPVVNDASRSVSQAVQPQPLVSPLYSESTFRNSVVNLDNNFSRVNSNRDRLHTSSNESAFIIPETRDHSAGLDFNDFLPKHIQQFGYDHQPPVSEMEAISSIVKGHKAAKAGLDYRRKQVQIVLAMWATKDSKTALEYAVNLDEKSIVIDILNVMILKASSWNLDTCLTMLPCIQELLESKYESYMSTGCSALSLILKTFSPIIKNNIAAPPGIGVDISREERYNKCMKCYNHLLSARAFVLKRQTLQGKIGRSFRELSILMQNLE